MNKLLLLTVACGVAGAINAFNKSEAIRVDNLPAEQVMIENTPETYFSPHFASAQDTVTLTVKWVLKNVTSEKDAINQFVLFDNDGNYSIVPSTVLSKATDKTTAIAIPKGVYNAIMIFNTKTPEAASIGKFVCMENINIVSDTTLTFSGKKATEKICFQYLLPNGDKPCLPTYNTSSKQTDYTGANLAAMTIARSFAHKKLSGWAFNTIYPVKDNRTSTGKDRTKSANIFINSGLSNNFYVTTTAMLTPLDTVTKSKSLTEPHSLISFQADCSKTDTTYITDIKKFFGFTPVKPTASLAADTVKLNYSYDYIYETLGADNRSISSIIYAGVPNENGKITLNLQSGEYSDMLISTMSIETTKTCPSSVADGAGISTPKMKIDKDGTVHYLMNDNLGEGMKDILSEAGGIFYPRNNPHKYYSYDSKSQNVEFGTSAPILSLPVFPSTPSASYHFTYANGIFLSPQWVANFGERRPIDLLAMKFTALAGTDTIAATWNEFRTKIATHAKPEHQAHKVTMKFDNNNFMVDSIHGRTYAELSYTEGNEDICIPTMQMLQFRNKDGRITNRFEKDSEGLMNLSYGDFNYSMTAKRYEVEDCEIKVETAPHGSDKFTELKTEQIADYFQMPVWGYFRRGVIDKNIGYSRSGWFDVRFTLKDKAGNTQIQTVSPAFHASFATNGLEETIVGNDAEITDIYDITGMRHADLVKGINIVKYSDGTTKKVFVRK